MSETSAQRGRPLLLVETTMANRHSGATDFTISDEEVGIRHPVLPRCDFYMPSGEEGAARVLEPIPYRVTHEHPSRGDSGCEPFNLWAEDDDFQQPSDHIDSRIGDQWPGFTAFFKKKPRLSWRRGVTTQDRPVRPPRSLPDRPTMLNHYPRFRSLSRLRSRYITLHIFPLGDGVLYASGQRGSRALALPLLTYDRSFRWTLPSWGRRSTERRVSRS